MTARQGSAHAWQLLCKLSAVFSATLARPRYSYSRTQGVRACACHGTPLAQANFCKTVSHSVGSLYAHQNTAAGLTAVHCALARAPRFSKKRISPLKPEQAWKQRRISQRSHSKAATVPPAVTMSWCTASASWGLRALC